MLCKKLLTASLAVCISIIMACSAWADTAQDAETDTTLVEAAPTAAAAESTESSTEETSSSSSGMTKLDRLRNAGPGVSASANTGTPGALTYVSDDTIIYGGVTYKKGDYQGTHKMSGYTWSAEYGNMTASGKGATSNHTVAYSSSLPLGTQIIIEYANGPLDHRYDGVYTIEDRGDYHIESEGWIDIFFDTYAQAAGITDQGWNYANVWVAIPQ